MTDLKELWKFAEENNIQQKEEEFYWFLNTIQEHKYKTVLEIGCHKGISTYCFSQICDLAIGIDKNKYEQWEKYRSDKCVYVLGHSKDSRTIHEVEEISNKNIDVLFIDGGHGIRQVLYDYEWYNSRVSSGGMIVFHDIADSVFHRKIRCGARKIYERVKHPYKYEEIIIPKDSTWGGLGVLYKP